MIVFFDLQKMLQNKTNNFIKQIVVQLFVFLLEVFDVEEGTSLMLGEDCVKKEAE